MDSSRCGVVDPQLSHIDVCLLPLAQRAFLTSPVHACVDLGKTPEPVILASPMMRCAAAPATKKQQQQQQRRDCMPLERVSWLRAKQAWCCPVGIRTRSERPWWVGATATRRGQDVDEQRCEATTTATRLGRGCDLSGSSVRSALRLRFLAMLLRAHRASGHGEDGGGTPTRHRRDCRTAGSTSRGRMSRKELSTKGPLLGSQNLIPAPFQSDDESPSSSIPGCVFGMDMRRWKMRRIVLFAPGLTKLLLCNHGLVS